MARPQRLEALLAGHRQGLPQTVKVADRSGVMVRAAAEPTPVVPDEQEVRVVRPALGLAVLNLLHGTLVHHQRAGARGCRECLLPPRVYHVHVPFVRLEGDATQRAHRVHDEEAIVRLRDSTHTLNLLHGSRGGLACAQEERLGLVLLDRGLELSKCVRLARRLLQADDLQTEAIGHIGNPGAPDPVLSHQNLLARLQQVRNTRLHRHVAGARDRAGILAVRLKQVPQVIRNFIHDLQEGRVHVTQHG
mmetsp:Transcript_6014/g.10419  ORF Transcript_6014/g.10419 Transcript_6014/m.10419 type:complete len:248 (-) Transcript_6014:279-1022(-)